MCDKRQQLMEKISEASSSAVNVCQTELVSNGMGCDLA